MLDLIAKELSGQRYGGPNQGTTPYLSLYPRMYLMPSGLVFQCGQIPNSFLWNPSPSSGAWTSVNITSQYRDYGTAILLPLQNTTTERGRLMLAGGSTTDLQPATTVVEIQDFNQGYIYESCFAYWAFTESWKKVYRTRYSPQWTNSCFWWNLPKVGAIQCSFRKSLIRKMRVKAGLI